MKPNKHFVLPKVYFIGATALDPNSLHQYLSDTDQREFLGDIKEAYEKGLNPGEILCSFYAKLCYASLTDKKNKNISKTRDIKSNILSILDSGHGSVLEHCQLNFVITNCSRVFTHELVRHRVGTAFSQTSGRYVRSDVLNLVIDPILEPIQNEVEELRKHIEDWYKVIEMKSGLSEMKDFDKKKKMTSALRRLLPNGQSNEMGFSLNLRTLRHTLEMRTSEHAEWEIRYVFEQIYWLLAAKYPMMFSDATTITIDDLSKVTFKNKKI